MKAEAASDAKTLIGELAAALRLASDWTRAAQLSQTITTPLDHFLQTHTVWYNQASARGADPAPGFAHYLGTITANPGNSLNTEIIDASFVFPRSTAIARPDAPIINASQSTLGDAITTWIARSRAFATDFASSTLPVRRESAANSRFGILFGDRGVGKTFLQNYIISHYWPTFDESRVLWIRISLVREFGGTIDHWVKAQVAKILARYYDPESSAFAPERSASLHFDVIEALRPVMESSSGKERDAIDNMVRVLRAHQSSIDYDVAPEWMPIAAVDAIFHAAVTRGFSFIVAIDGLDLLDHTPALREHFISRLEALGKYLKTDASLWRYHLVFLRQDSMEDFAEHVTSKLLRIPDQHRPVDTYEIAPVSLKAIIERRLEVLARNHIVSIIGTYTAADVESFAGYLESMDSGLPNESGADRNYADAVNEVSGTNIRSAMHVIHAAAAEYMQLNTPHYMLTDRLMRVGCALPPRSPRYKRVTDRDGIGHMVRQQGGTGYHMYDANFLPALFRFPFADSAVPASELSARGRTQILIGLRLLQLATVMSARETLLERTDERSLVRRTCEIFDYESAVVSAMCEELMDEDVLHTRVTDSRYRSPDASTHLLRVAPKGAKILDRYMFDPTYLNVGSFNLPVPSSLVEDVAHDYAFSVVPMGIHSDIDEIVFGKIVNALLMANLICDANKLQHDEVRRRSQSFGKKSADLLRFAEASVSKVHGGLFSFEERLRTEVHEICERILSGLDPKRYRRIMRRLRNLSAGTHALTGANRP